MTEQQAAPARSPGGRPVTYTPERGEAICEALRSGGSRTAAAQYVRSTLRTLENWMTRFPEFRASVLEAEARAELRAVVVIRDAFVGGDWRAAAWWLERRRSDDWGRKDRVEILATVRQMARDAGEDEEAAVVEADRFLKELRGVK